jgi:hypothetical protein
MRQLLPRLIVRATARHRNGISGAPFHVVLFDDIDEEDTLKVGIVFDEPSSR